MILFELTGQREDHHAYRALAVSNGDRHYDFLQSVVTAALAIDRPFLSQTVIRAINYHAIACLHSNAGEYRPCPVTVGEYRPPEHYRVPALMDDFVNLVNRSWSDTHEVKLASFVLWRLNHIHPFINGNGRTARAACYFVLCIEAGGWLTGNPILPELLRQPEHKPRCVEALRHADRTATGGEADLEPLQELLSELLYQQLSSS